MKVSKEMFIHEKSLSGINDEFYKIVFSTTKTHTFTKPVTVTYEVDRKVEITESQLEEAWKESDDLETLKEKIFGDSNE